MKLFVSRLVVILTFIITLVSVGCNSSSSSDTQQQSSTPKARPSEGDLSALHLDKASFEKGIGKSGSTILDVRQTPEFEKGHIEGAVNISFFDAQFKNSILELNRNKAYYIYDKNGNTAEMTMKFMLDNDFKEVFILKEGYEKWNASSTN